MELFCRTSVTGEVTSKSNAGGRPVNRSIITTSSGSNHNRDSFIQVDGSIGPARRELDRDRRGDGSNSPNARFELVSVWIALSIVITEE